MSSIDYHRVRQQVSMTQVLDLIGFQATRRRGPQLRGSCPIPNCRSTSHRAFSVHLTRQIYHCFACGSHGNPLDLWAAVRRLHLHPAAIDLYRTVSLPLPRLTTSTAPAVPEPQSVPFRAPLPNHKPGPH